MFDARKGEVFGWLSWDHKRAALLYLCVVLHWSWLLVMRIRTTPQEDNSPPYRFWSWWVVLFRGSGPSGELSWWGIVLGIVVLVGNDWALFLSGGELSSWGIVLEPLWCLSTISAWYKVTDQIKGLFTKEWIAFPKPFWIVILTLSRFESLILPFVNAKFFQIRLLKCEERGVLDRDPPRMPDSEDLWTQSSFGTWFMRAHFGNARCSHKWAN